MEQKLRSLIKEAMAERMSNRSVETENRYQTLKNILETAQKVAKDKKSDTISDSMIVDAAKKEIKQLNDLLGYCKGNDVKQAEIAVCLKTAEELLPQMATTEEITTFVNSHKTEAGNIGLMMKLLKSEFGDKLDGKMASDIVKNTL